jgi:general secretion pathway protein D
MLLDGTRRRRWLSRATMAVLMTAATCTTAAGCRVPEAALPDGGPGVEARVSGAEAVDGSTALRMRLESEYWRGMGRLAYGETEEATAILQAVNEEAERAGVEFGPDIEDNLWRVATGRLPVLPARLLAGAGDLSTAAEAPLEAVPASAAHEETGTTRETEPLIVGPPAHEVRMPRLEEPGMADKLVSVDFNQVDIMLVLKTVSDITGINFLPADGVQGPVTLIGPTQVRVGDLYSVLESILAMKNYAPVPSRDMVKIVPRAEVSKYNLETRIGDLESIPADDSVVTQIIPLEYVEPQEVLGWVNAAVAPGSYVFVPPKVNAIAISGISSNIHQIAKLIQQFDIPAARASIKIIRLKHSPAGDLAEKVSQILAEASVPSPQPGQAPVRVATETKILPDTRTNSLIVVARPEDTKVIEDLVGKLDVERPLEAGNVHVVHLQHVEAATVAEALSALTATLAEEAGEQKAESVRINAYEPTNSLIVVASAEDFGIMEEMIGKLDVIREQVLVEMCIMEASEDVVRELGVEWTTIDPAGEDMRGFGGTDFGIRVEQASGTLEGLTLGAFKLGRDGSPQVAAILNALENESGVNILSKPHIVTSNHEESRIFVGESIPFVKQSRVTETDPASPTAIKTYDYEDVGIEMVITPHVTHGGVVRLEIDSKFTKVIEGPTGVSAETPTTASREATTVVSVDTGATVVIGGLMRDDEVSAESKVPLLGDIPVLGWLFKRTKRTTQKTNLLLFITPHVLTGREAMERMTREKEEQLGLDPRSGM